ncbi:cytochrome P450 [Rhodococcus sp. MSC1_016]|jgi:cytochrome P450|uniref:cytochrome P450 n=1 Tax=Rhodococcus sp. MSC1_016 TaxID=2909266 RepID=UPI00202FDC46|nr:cytochrome P450 [Rhodococcus sp. MSC1_016]
MSMTAAGGQQADTASPPNYPFAREPKCPFDPPVGVRHEDQMPKEVSLWDGRTAWLFTRHDHVRTLFADPRVSHDTNSPDYPHESAGFRERAHQGQSFVNQDDPEHARGRRMVNAGFVAKRVRAMREPIQTQVDQLIDDMLGGPKPVDLVSAFALPVPSLMICLLLGVPPGEQGRFQTVVGQLMRQDTPPETVNKAQGELFEYLEELIAEKQKTPREDVLSDLATKNVATGQITPREAAIIARLLLSAGHDTTANMISLSTALLLQHPDQLDELRQSDDPALMAAAVEELLRYLSIIHNGPRRFALEDIELDGHQIKAGDGLILSVDGANRSPELYPAPDNFDIHRPPTQHLAFGWGPHGCIGQTLARLELQIALGTLIRRIPTLRLATEVTELDFKHDAIVYGLHSMPVTW